MKNFILNILTSFIIILLVLFALDKLATYGLSKSRANSFRDLNDLYENKTNADMVLLGSSRTYVMMNPIVFDSILNINTHNFGQDGATIYLQKTIFNEVLECNDSSLKYVVQNIDLTTLLPNKKNYSKQRYFPHLDKKSLYNNLYEFDYSFWKYKYIPFYKFNGNLSIFIRGLFLGLNIPLKENYTKVKGYRPGDKIWNSDFDNFKANLKTDVISYDENLLEEGLKVLEEFIEETSRIGVKYIIVFAPMYAEMYNMQLQNKMLISRLQGYADKFEHVSFYDYSNLPMNTKKSYFYNSYHLNSTGADIFSEILANDLKLSMEIEK